MKSPGWLILLLVAASACGSSTPPTPTTPGGPAESITGRERLGWDQRAADASELGAFGWAVYADGARSVIADTACATTGVAGTFACTGRLPPLSPGAHTLELVSFLSSDQTLESARSTAIQVTVTAASPGSDAPDWESGLIETSRDGTRLRVERVLDGLEDPADAIFAPDGRLFIAERPGRITVLGPELDRVDTTLLTDVDAQGQRGLLSIALDPDFERTHFIYAVYTASTTGPAAFRLARFRDVRGTLAERAILLDAIPSSPDRPSAALRAGPDGSLYLAIDDGGDRSSADSPSSMNGKLLRLTTDGATPRDQASATPVFMNGLHAPRGLSFDPRTGWLWLTDADGPRGGSLAAIAIDGRPLRPTVRAAHDLKAGAAGAIAIGAGVGVAAWRSDLFMASEHRQFITRIRVDAGDPSVIIDTELLLADRVGPVRVVLIGPDGAIYFCTANRLGRLVPQ